MAYSALFAAAFTGDALHGALLMAGFGMGTLPALLGVVFVVGRWATRASGVGRQAAGLVIAGFAAVTLILAQPGGPLCVGP
jgi:sulfite exporter TauE/SafE